MKSNQLDNELFNEIKGYWKDGILGLVVGDALGVPVEFARRSELADNPVTDMRGYGTHSQPRGTWSDDSSMTLATLDCIRGGRYTPEAIMEAFCEFYDNGKYTPYGEVFDIGTTCICAIEEYEENRDLSKCGCSDEHSNGNGSLMRILPVCLKEMELMDEDPCKSLDDCIDTVHEMSGLTHNHMRSKIACGMYYFLVKEIVKNRDRLSLRDIIDNAVSEGYAYYMMRLFMTEDMKEINFYNRIRDINTFAEMDVDQIKSSGYVVDTLEAAIWSLLNTDTYRDCVLRCVNLGGDTDTIAAVAGGLAGLYYGCKTIPASWVESLSKSNILESISDII